MEAMGPDLKRLECSVREFGFHAGLHGWLLKAIHQKRTCLMKVLEIFFPDFAEKNEIEVKLVPKGPQLFMSFCS